MSELYFTWYGGLADENGLHNESRRAREGREFEEQHGIDRATARSVEQAKARGQRLDGSASRSGEQGASREELQRTTEEIGERVHERLVRQVRHNRLEASDAHDSRSTRGESELQHGMKMPTRARKPVSDRRVSPALLALVGEQLRAASKRTRRDGAAKRQVSTDRMRVENVIAPPRQRRGR